MLQLCTLLYVSRSLKWCSIREAVIYVRFLHSQKKNLHIIIIEMISLLLLLFLCFQTVILLLLTACQASSLSHVCTTWMRIYTQRWCAGVENDEWDFPASVIWSTWNSYLMQFSACLQFQIEIIFSLVCVCVRSVYECVIKICMWF